MRLVLIAALSPLVERVLIVVDAGLTASLLGHWTHCSGAQVLRKNNSELYRAFYLPVLVSVLLLYSSQYE